MYAVIETGGKQYRVQEGDQITVEKLLGDVGSKIQLETVLCVKKGEQLVLGKPQVENASVDAEVVLQGRGEKIVVFKKKRRKGYSRKQGHRQSETTLKIIKING